MKQHGRGRGRQRGRGCPKALSAGPEIVDISDSEPATGLAKQKVDVDVATDLETETDTDTDLMSQEGHESDSSATATASRPASRRKHRGVSNGMESTVEVEAKVFDEPNAKPKPLSLSQPKTGTRKIPTDPVPHARAGLDRAKGPPSWHLNPTTVWVGNIAIVRREDMRAGSPSCGLQWKNNKLRNQSLMLNQIHIKVQSDHSKQKQVASSAYKLFSSCIVVN